MKRMTPFVNFFKSKTFYVFSFILGFLLLSTYFFTQTSLNAMPNPSMIEKEYAYDVDLSLHDVSVDGASVEGVSVMDVLGDTMPKDNTGVEAVSYVASIPGHASVVGIPDSLAHETHTLPKEMGISFGGALYYVLSVNAHDFFLYESNKIFADVQAEFRQIEENFFDVVIPMICPYDPSGRYSIEEGENGTMLLSSYIEVGDSAGSILSEWLTMTEVLTLVDVSKKIHPITSLRLGRAFTVTVDVATKELVAFQYEIDNTTRLSIDYADELSVARKEFIPYEIVLSLVDGNIEVNFFDAVLNAGENANFAVKLARIFSFDIDFVREIRSGDRFTALVEKRFREEKFVGYGRILGAYFENDNKLFEAFLFHDGEGDFTYYDSKGIALQKAFLKTPLSFTRISSRYSMRRKHPILGITRPHQGVDYAAPMGTPVMSVGDGKITKAAYSGGYGHLIVVKHKGGLISQYAHLSKYGRGVRRGVNVKQGQIIGYVGSTGLSTGPHLDFRMRKYGKFINPDNIIVPSKDPVKKNLMSVFSESVAVVRSYMEQEKELTAFVPDTWLR